MTYFPGGKYDWSYDAAGGSNPGHHSGSGSVDAYSARIRPEVSVALSDALRVFVNGAAAVTTWSAGDDESKPEYVGVDIYSAVGLGVRYTFGK